MTQYHLVVRKMLNDDIYYTLTNYDIIDEIELAVNKANSIVDDIILSNTSAEKASFYRSDQESDNAYAIFTSKALIKSKDLCRVRVYVVDSDNDNKYYTYRNLTIIHDNHKFSVYISNYHITDCSRLGQALSFIDTFMAETALQLEGV